MAGVKYEYVSSAKRHPPVTVCCGKSVEIVKEHDTSPQLKCKNCAKTFCGGATRIELHICEQCDCDTTTFLEMKEKVLSKKTRPGPPQLVGP